MGLGGRDEIFAAGGFDTVCGGANDSCTGGAGNSDLAAASCEITNCVP